MKQRNIKWVGGLVESIFSTLPFLGIWNYIAIAIVLYTNVYPYLVQYFPWVKLWIFLLCLIGVGIIGMFIMYKFVLPSLWAFRGKQMFQRDGELQNLMQKLNDKLEEEEMSDTIKLRKYCCGNCTLRNPKGLCKIQGSAKEDLNIACYWIHTNYKDNGFERETNDFIETHNFGKE